MRYHLKPATEADRAWLEELRRSVYQELFVATWGAWNEARHRRHCDECWERGNICTVEVKGERVGMIQVHEDGGGFEVGEIQILPAHQGLGIGSRLLEDVVARAHAQDRKVSLSTGLKNIRAVELYERLGFRHVAQSDTHFHLESKPPARGKP